MVTQDDVLRVISQRGPIIPNEVRKALGVQDNFLVGALLSELKSFGKIHMTAMRMGGSPIYYLLGQEPKLVNFIGYLNEKDRRTAEALQKHQVVQDKGQSPLIRVSLRTIKDFSSSFSIKENGEDVLFWRWYLLDEEQAKQKAYYILHPEKKPVALDPVQKTASQVNESAQHSPPIMPAKEVAPAPQAQPIVNQESTKTVAPSVEQKPLPVPPAPQKKEVQQTVLSQKLSIQEDPRPQISVTPLEKPTAVVSEQTISSNEGVYAELDSSSFLSSLKRFFTAKKIAVLLAKQLRKNADYEFIIAVPSPVGSVRFACKAKNKKKLSENDVVAIYFGLQQYRLPTMLISTGDVAKKAQDRLDKDLSGLTLVQLEEQ
ncbi:MAG: hypothetical protein H6502_01420 [Candidatus Woesearchaeota archaeon]|nr:MAG: hypothetical protein H6502_01420 [Candidatus Woesearchaeota archaeon]